MASPMQRQPADKPPQRSPRGQQLRPVAGGLANEPHWAWKLVPLVIAAAGAIAYSNTLGNPFIFDDLDSIVNKGDIRQLWPIWKPMSGPLLTRPILYLSLAINYAISEQHEWSYHVFNIVIHTLGGMTLWGIARRTLTSERLASRFGQAAYPLATIIALVWTLHPLQTAAVTYIVQRAESMMGMFYLLTLYCVIRSAGSRRPILWVAAAVFAGVMGMGIKQVMVTAPFVIAIYDRIFLPAPTFTANRWLRAAILTAVFAIIGAVLSAGVLMLMGSPAIDADSTAGGGLSGALSAAIGPYRLYFASTVGAFAMLGLMTGLLRRRTAVYLPLAFSWIMLLVTMTCTGGGSDTAGAALMDKITPLQYAQTQFGVICHYLRMCYWPHPLVMDYYWPVATSASDIWPYAVVIAALLALTAVALWRWPAAGLLGVWFFMILSPSSSILPIKDMAFEHRMYLPLAAVVAMTVCGVYMLIGDWLGFRGVVVASAAKPVPVPNLPAAVPSVFGLRSTVAVVFAAGVAVVLIALGTVTFIRNYDYSTVLGIWQDTALKRPGNARAVSNVGVAMVLYKHDYDIGQKKLRQAIEIDPNFADAYYNLGICRVDMGDSLEAIELFRQAIRVQANHSGAWVNLCLALERTGNDAQAVEAYRMFIQNCPNHMDGRFKFATLLMKMNRFQDAYDELKKICYYDANIEVVHSTMAECLNKLGRFTEAGQESAIAQRLRNKGSALIGN